MMEPGRIHAYLQAACAGLGFDIGEVWFSPNETSKPIPNPVGEENGCIDDEILASMKRDRTSERSRKFKFLQLYTSKSYNNRRNDLLRPASGECEDNHKHVLSPDVVDVISTTSQVVWAHCPKREGPLARSDMRLQTAVGMPVAVDSDGNMCVVVMFSAKNIRSNQNAVEYLRLFRQTAKSPSIPCLLPVVDNHHKKLVYNLQCFSDWQEQKLKSLSGNQVERNQSSVEIPTSHEVTLAPKDPYGIPILPSTAELDTAHGEGKGPSSSSDDFTNAFDLASFGIWSTVMNMPSDYDVNAPVEKKVSIKSSQVACPLSITTIPKASALFSSTSSCDSILSLGERPYFQPERGDRLEEFASAFLGISVFDLADVWIPDLNCSGNVRLHHLRSVSVAGKNEGLNNLMQVSQNSVIKACSGAIGRAYNSGNPIWGTKKDIIFDSERAEAFAKANVKTMLAVPIYSPNNTNPSGVFCCYSLIQSDSVPFLLKFVQQALRTLWMGLDHVEPNKNIDKDLWKDVAPADLGEMAADLEMQKAFYQKKRTYDNISLGTQDSGKKIPAEHGHTECQPSTSSISLDLQTLGIPYRESSTPLHLKTNRVTNTINPAESIASALSIGKQDIQTHQKISSLKKSEHTMATTIPWSNNGEGPVPQAESLTPLKLEINTGPPGAQVNASAQKKKDLVDIIYTNRYVVAPSNHKEDHVIVMGNIHEFNALVMKSKYQSQSEEVTTFGKHETSLRQKPVLMRYGEECFSSPETISQAANQIATGNITASDILLLDASHFTTKPFPLEIQVKPSATGSTAITPIPSSISTESMGLLSPCGKKCRIVGCTEVSVLRRPYCHRHSGNRLCEHPSCSKCAQGATRFCIAHGGGRRCTYKGCDKGARDKYFCAAHGGGRRCKSDGCSKSAVGGSNLCTSHGGGRRCAVDGCGKSAQSSTKFCVKHGGGKKCTYSGCDKVARGRTSFCAAHGGGVRCKLEGCNRIAIGKMQMCRTHGGGLKKSISSVILSIPTDTIQSNQIPITASSLLQTPKESSINSNLPTYCYPTAP